jgi:transmembrane sensor
MKVGPIPTHQVEARSWLLKLRTETLSHQDIVDWQAWLEADPRNAAAYDEAVAAWELACQVPMAPAAATELASDRYDGTVPVQQWRRRPQKQAFWLIATAAAAASIVVTVAVVKLAMLSPDPPSRQVASAPGQRELVLLSDGSKVILGGMTMVDIRYTKRERQLVLGRGQAAFKVAHGQAQPFVVKTQHAAVTAIGTAFDINLKRRSMVLVVTEGAVEVDPVPETRVSMRSASQPVRVSAGQTLTITPDGMRLQSELPFGGGWENGWLAYRNEPLASVVEDVNRYLQTPVRLQDPSLGELTYTGTVELSNIPAWVDALPSAFPVEISRTTGGLLLKEKSNHGIPKRSPQAS